MAREVLSADDHDDPALRAIRELLGLPTGEALPGAAGVRSALSVADSANARRAREDSIMADDP